MKLRSPRELVQTVDEEVVQGMLMLRSQGVE